ncbi:hypothetical protein [Streptomyces sp. NPDC086777]|uniref:hypothetical protein n=1 Tax=Streptomyces sp. NPDC086777 TaxID=3154866 RepID=UPI00344E3446
MGDVGVQTPMVTPGTSASRSTCWTTASSWRATAGVIARTPEPPDGDGAGEDAANAAGAAAGAATRGTVSVPSTAAIAAPRRSMADVCGMG